MMPDQVAYPPPIFVFGDPCPPAYVCTLHGSWKCSTPGPSACRDELVDCIQDVLASVPAEPQIMVGRPDL